MPYKKAVKIIQKHIRGFLVRKQFYFLIKKAKQSELIVRKNYKEK